MRIRSGLASHCLIALVYCSACGRERTSTDGSTTSLAAPATRERIPPHAERPMAGRQEAQPFLDSAGVLLVRGDTNAAIAMLHRAAALVQVMASQPRGPASDALRAAGDSLDRYAGALARRETPAQPSLRHISALLNLAEADRHLSLAGVACSTRSRESIYDELTMALDHVERASRDGEIPLPGRTRAAIAEVRRAATPLASECPQDLAPLEDAIASLEPEIAVLRRALKAQ